jgi:hypothetical protein
VSPSFTFKLDVNTKTFFFFFFFKNLSRKCSPTIGASRTGRTANEHRLVDTETYTMVYFRLHRSPKTHSVDGAVLDPDLLLVTHPPSMANGRNSSAAQHTVKTYRPRGTAYRFRFVVARVRTRHRNRARAHRRPTLSRAIYVWSTAYARTNALETVNVPTGRLNALDVIRRGAAFQYPPVRPVQLFYAQCTPCTRMVRAR